MTREPTTAAVADPAAPPPADVPWHNLSADDALRRLSSEAAVGLTEEEAERRRSTYGANVLERDTGESPWRILWRQINSPLIWALLASSLLAVAIGKVTDGLVVLTVVVLNALVGFVQEFRAGRAIASLSQMVPENATAVRGGRPRSLPVADLVPGDVILLAGGDRVPADVRLLAVKNLTVEESALTGESVPVSKNAAPVTADAGLGDRLGMAYSGSLVTAGTGTGLVVATGARTELGRISTLMRETTELETPLTRDLAQLGRVITLAIAAVAVVLFAVGTWRIAAQGATVLGAVRETALFAISLAVGAIPEGLPAVVTIALAIGVQRMASRRAIVRQLPAVETLGSTTVICSDKTGTLTRNEMTVTAAWTPAGSAGGDGLLCRIEGVGYAPEGGFRCGGDGAPTADRPPEAVRRLLEIGALCNDSALERGAGGAWKIAGDPTEAALVVAAEKAGIHGEEARQAQPRLDAIPFESERQYMATLHDNSPDGSDGGHRRVLLKGAPEVVLRRCDHTAGGEPLAPEAVQAMVERLAGEGSRLLALAEKPWKKDNNELTEADVEGGLTFVGLVGMIDPPRPEAIEAIAACRRAGIAVKMITGDHQATARAIGRQLGLIAGDEPAVTGAELGRTDDEALRRVAAGSAVFARVAPEHKLRLVRALQAEGNVVAMTGDGVNDAPALKQADIGVAMGITGTSVSKEAAALVLTDDNFASITAAVEEGRRVNDNLIKSLAFILPTNLGLALVLVCAVLFFPFDPATGSLRLPMQPVQILWINLVATVTLALSLAFERAEADVMDRPPRPPHQPILTRFLVIRTVVAALMMAGASVALFVYEYQKAAAQGGGVAASEVAQAQSMVVTTVIMYQIFYLLECRSLRRPLFALGVFSNPAVFLGIGALLVLQALFLYVPFLNRTFGSSPLHPADIGLAALAGALILPVIGVEKALRARGRLPFADD